MAGMIILFQGRRGSGKTLSLVACSTLFKGWNIKSNFNLKGVNRITEQELFSLNKSSKLKNCVILIDEAQIFFDSRNWKNSSSITFSHFIQQIRKRNIIILATTQYLDTLEKRLRQHIDVIARPNIHNGLVTLTFFDLTSLEDSSFPSYFKLTYDPKPYYKLYDTNEIL